MINIGYRNVLNDLHDMCFNGRAAMKRLTSSVASFFKSIINAIYFSIVTFGWMVGVSACIGLSSMMIIYDFFSKLTCRK